MNYRKAIAELAAYSIPSCCPHCGGTVFHLANSNDERDEYKCSSCSGLWNHGVRVTHVLYTIPQPRKETA